MHLDTLVQGQGSIREKKKSTKKTIRGGRKQKKSGKMSGELPDSLGYGNYLVGVILQQGKGKKGGKREEKIKGASSRRKEREGEGVTAHI